MQLEEGQLVPIAALECDLAAEHVEKPASPEAQRVAPFEDRPFAVLEKIFDDADHFGCGEFPDEHGSDGVASFDRVLGHLVIDGIGAVQPSGSQQVTPAESTTYHLAAKGAGGTQEATARVTVAEAPPPPPPAAGPSEEELFSESVKDVYFDYDKDDIRGDQQSSVQSDVQFLSQHSSINLTIEGHCDERGSTDYNIALGDKRASAVKNALTAGGVSASRIKTISYGKEKPFCTESNEACWQQNRRGHLTYQK